MPKDALEKQDPRLAEQPFDSERKLLTTVQQIDGNDIVIVKGTFDMLALRRIAEIWRPHGT